MYWFIINKKVDYFNIWIECDIQEIMETSWKIGFFVYDYEKFIVSNSGNRSTHVCVADFVGYVYRTSCLWEEVSYKNVGFTFMRGNI